MCLSTKPLDVTRKFSTPSQQCVVAFRVFFTLAQVNTVHAYRALTRAVDDVAEGVRRSPERCFSWCGIQANTFSLMNEVFLAVRARGPFVYYFILVQPGGKTDSSRPKDFI